MARNPVFKETYKGHGIYWHRPYYGDETQVISRTIQGCKRRIDSAIDSELAVRPDHLKYWDTVPHEDREQWRKLSIASELSASELAYTNRRP